MDVGWFAGYPANEVVSVRFAPEQLHLSTRKRHVHQFNRKLHYARGGIHPLIPFNPPQI